MELKQQKEQASNALVERFKKEEEELKIQRENEKRQKLAEEERREKERKKNMDARLKSIREREEEEKRRIDEMLKARIKKVVKIATPPKPKKPKIDPNKVKFNVTEMIKNRSNNSPSIIHSSSKKRVQSNIVKNNDINFPSRQSVPRNKYGGYLSAIDVPETIEDKLNKSTDSHVPTVDTNRKLPSLRKRLNKRLVEPLYMKATKQLEIRRQENINRIKDKEKSNDKQKQEMKKRRNVLDRLTILGNISVGPSSTKNSKIHDIWKAHDSVIKSVKNSEMNLNRIELSNLDSSLSKEETKDILDKEIEKADREHLSQREKKLHNQLSLFSHVESADSFLDESITFKSNRKLKKKFKRGKSRRRRQNFSVMPTTIESTLNKKIESINPTFDEAFRYHQSDIHELSEDPTIKKKLENISDIASPRFLMALKKKQRMQEYWRGRVRKDFTKLNKNSDDENVQEIKDNQAIRKLMPTGKPKLK